MPFPSSILDYRTREASPVGRAIRRFQIIYAIGITAAYATVGICLSAWPHTSNLADPRKAVLDMVIQVAGGMACAWLAVALYRIVRAKAVRQSIWTWLLVAANAFVALTVLPVSYT